MDTQLIELFTLPESLPADFFANKKYSEQLELAIKETGSLVYALDGDGEKRAKQDATSINKFAKLFDSFVAAEYKAQTGVMGEWRAGNKQRISVLLENRQKLINQFAEKRAERLAFIESIINLHLAYAWNEKAVRVEYQNELGLFEAAIKLSSLTPKDAVSAPAKRIIDEIVSLNSSQQMLIDGRIIEIENKCLRAEINPPFSKEYLGDALFSDDEFFNQKLSELIGLELKRRAEHEERIKKQAEATKQAEIDAALKAQQIEADKIARDKAQQAQEKAVNEATHRANEQKKLNQLNQEQAPEATAKAYQEPAREPEKAPAAIPQNGKHAVRMTIEFNMQISDRVSDDAVKDWLLNQLPDNLKGAISYAEATTC